MTMQDYTYTCPCGVTRHKRQSDTMIQPRYCSRACTTRYAAQPAARAARLGMHHYTPAMDAALLEATTRFGGVAALSRTDSRFAAMSASALSCRILRLDGYQRRAGHARPPWTPAEDTYALRHWQTMTLAHLAKKMRERGWFRSAGSIGIRMRLLTEERQAGDHLSVHQIVTGLHVQDRTVHAWIKRGWLAATLIEGSPVQRYAITPVAFARFVRTYPDEAGRNMPGFAWVLGILFPTGAGDTQDRSTADGGDGRWMNGASVRERAYAP